MDSSTPSQYDPSMGWLLFYLDRNGVDVKESKLPVTGGVLTKNGLDRYNALISAYQAKFWLKYSVVLSPNVGVNPYADKYGNSLWRLDSEHCEYYGRLADMQKNRVEMDTTKEKALFNKRSGGGSYRSKSLPKSEEVGTAKA